MVSTTTSTSEARECLYRRFADRIQPNPALSRKLVSYQGNKRVPGLRWLKYKEGFSSDLVTGFLQSVKAHRLLAPFSGFGTAPLTGGVKCGDITDNLQTLTYNGVQGYE